jgi:hypothetical protein
MRDPREHRKTANALGEYRPSLVRLYERFDAVFTGPRRCGRVDLHQLILDRPRADRAYAEAAGWTARALERDRRSGRRRSSPCR